MSSVAVLIPTYNRADFISDAIKSVLAQSRPAEEIIVINDGSTDNTVDVIKAFGEKVRLVEQPNAGKAKALNLGLSLTKSDYIWIVDDDDLTTTDALELLTSELDLKPEVDVVFARYKTFVYDGEKMTFSDEVHWARSEEPDWTVSFLESMFTLQGAMLVRRSAYEKVGPFNIEFVRSQDYEMTLRLLRECQFHFLDKAIFLQRQHSGLRGSAKERFSVTQKHEKWLKYDRHICEWMRDHFELSAFTPTFARSLPGNETRRAALVQRASIFAKNSLWVEALNDLDEAASLSPAQLSPDERHILEIVPNREGAWLNLMAESELVERLRAFQKSKKRFLIEASLAITSSVYWNARNLLLRGKAQAAVNWWKRYFKLVGVGGHLRRILSRLPD